MKHGILTTAALLATLALVTTAAVFAQPKPDGGYEPGFWQPKAEININLPIELTLINETGFTVDYSSEAVGGERGLPPGTSVSLNNLSIDPNSGTDLDRNINILINPTPTEGNALLHFDITSEANAVTVRIRLQATEEETQDKGLYVDEQGRVYVF